MNGTNGKSGGKGEQGDAVKEDEEADIEDEIQQELQGMQQKSASGAIAVSYTHLTLPTKRIV